jgi:hypothetical protein
MTEKTYLSCADTAKLLRKALKAAHPGVKFSVRSDTYAGGASIRVKWTDGPTEAQVKETTSLYNGATFDGMIDLKSYHDSLLIDEDGNVQNVHFGADFIFTDRAVGNTAAATYRREVERFIGQPVTDWYDTLPTDKDGYGVNVHKDYDTGVSQLSRSNGWRAADNLAQAVRMVAAGREWHGTECPGGDGAYCPGCGRWQGQIRSKHLY